MKIRYDGHEYEVDLDDLTFQEGHDAEQHLGFDVSEARSMGKMMLVLYVGMRHAEPDRDPKVIAAEVKTAKIVKLEDDDEEVDVDPPAPSGETGALRAVEPSDSETTPGNSGLQASASASA